MSRWYYILYLFFFFKQKTAYEMRISDWSSDVCSSDLIAFSEADGRPDEEGAAQRIIGRRIGVAAVLGRAAIVVADHGRLLVEQVVDAAAQREALGHVIAADRKSTRLNSSH